MAGCGLLFALAGPVITGLFTPAMDVAALAARLLAVAALFQFFDGGQVISADLALDASPVTPPETLLPRLHREMGAQARRRRPIYLVAVAASVAAAVGMGGFALTQGARANRLGATNQQLAAAIDFAPDC